MSEKDEPVEITEAQESFINSYLEEAEDSHVESIEPIPGEVDSIRVKFSDGFIANIGPYAAIVTDTTDYLSMSDSYDVKGDPVSERPAIDEVTLRLQVVDLGISLINASGGAETVNDALVSIQQLYAFVRAGEVADSAAGGDRQTPAQTPAEAHETVAGSALAAVLARQAGHGA